MFLGLENMFVFELEHILEDTPKTCFRVRTHSGATFYYVRVRSRNGLRTPPLPPVPVPEFLKSVFLNSSTFFRIPSIFEDVDRLASMFDDFDVFTGAPEGLRNRSPTRLTNSV